MTTPDDDSDRLLVEVNELDDAYAGASLAECYDKDLLALVRAARAVVSRNHRGADTETERALRVAVDQFEPWLEQDEDPRSMGWVDDRGRP